MSNSNCYVGQSFSLEHEKPLAGRIFKNIEHLFDLNIPFILIIWTSLNFLKSKSLLHCDTIKYDIKVYADKFK